MPGSTTTVDGVDVEHLGNASIALESGGYRVYLDVFGDVLSGDEPDGDLFLSSHAHFDHYDPDVINDLGGADAPVVAHESSDVAALQSDGVETVSAWESLTVDGVDIETVPAHNVVRTRPSGEHFHPEGEGVGYVFSFEGVRFYHPGDTEPLEHMVDVDVDVMFVPIGGFAVMGLHDAYWALHLVQPSVAIPVHYGYVDGSRESADGFADLVDTLAVEDGVDVEARVL